MVFKIVMGMIVGIAILVGGIGVLMNVSPMSVAERTREIGGLAKLFLRAKRSVIAFQLITEALAISSSVPFWASCLA